MGSATVRLLRGVAEAGPLVDGCRDGTAADVGAGPSRGERGKKTS